VAKAVLRAVPAGRPLATRGRAPAPPLDPDREAAEILERLRAAGVPESLAGMARYGIAVSNAFGVAMGEIERLARGLRKGRSPEACHGLARRLWQTGNREARLLAALVDEPGLVTSRQMERWALAFDSWDLCDGVCGHLFDRTELAWRKAREWAEREQEFVRRAGFTLMARLAVRDKAAKDQAFLPFLRLVEQGAKDERNYVKKSVNWALRQIGKRNRRLHRAAVACAERVARQDSRAARWIAADALRELRSQAVQSRLLGRGPAAERARRSR